MLPSRLICLVVLSFCAHSVLGAPSLDAYGKLPKVSRMVISPNGERIAYRDTASDDEDFVVVYSLKKQEIVTALRVDEIDPQYMKFVGDDYLLLFATRHVASIQFTHEFDAGTVFVYDIADNQVRPLVQLGESIGRDRLVYQGQLIDNLIGASKDGRELYIGAYVSDSVTDNTPRYSLLRVKRNGKGSPSVVSRGTEDVVDYFLDGDDKPVARVERNHRYNTHTVSMFDGKDWNELYRYEAEIATHSFRGLTSDYESLVFLRNDEDELRYYTLSLSDGDVGELADQSIEKSIERLLYDDRNVVIGVQYSGLAPSYRMFDAALDKRVQDLVALFPDHAVYLSSWSPDQRHILLLVEGPQFAGDYILASDGEKPRWISAMRPGIKSEDFSLQAILQIKARDGFNMPTILTLPNDTVDNPVNLPAVMLPHGGPESHDTLGFDFMAQALASRGYLVVQPQFRGSSGFSKQHRTAGHGEWGRKMQDDLTDALAYLVDGGVVDPGRVCIVGASYGGYAALVGAAFTPDLYQCAVSIAGISHLPRMLQDDKSRYGKDHAVMRYLEMSILDGEFDKEALKEISPYFFADQVQIPVLLMHGEDDKVVEFDQSRMMHRALSKAGKSVQLIRLDNEDHYLQEGSTRLQALQAMIAFVDQHIGNNRAAR